MKDKIIYVAQSVRNLSIHHVRTVLPYGVILLVLGGVGFLWDGNPTEMQADSREKTQTEHASSPSFTATAQQNGEDGREGTLLFGTAAAASGILFRICLLPPCRRGRKRGRRKTERLHPAIRTEMNLSENSRPSCSFRKCAVVCRTVRRR